MPTSRQVHFYSASKTITFDGSPGNGDVGTVALFAVTGRVIVLRTVAYCTSSLVSGGGTLSLGTASAPALAIPAANATIIDTGELWLDASTSLPLASGVDFLGSWQAFNGVALEDDDLILTVGTAAISDGQIDFEVHWSPVSGGGSVS